MQLAGLALPPLAVRALRKVQRERGHRILESPDVIPVADACAPAARTFRSELGLRVLHEHFRQQIVAELESVPRPVRPDPCARQSAGSRGSIRRHLEATRCFKKLVRHVESDCKHRSRLTFPDARKRQLGLQERLAANSGPAVAGHFSAPRARCARV